MENKLAERRKFERIGIDCFAEGRLFDSVRKTEISRSVPIRAKNLSEEGALLDWPRSWDCDICSNCLGWLYNFRCKLKEKEQFQEDFNKKLIPDIHMELRIILSDGMDPLEVLARIMWVKSSSEAVAERYPIGVYFVGDGKKAVEIKKKLQIIKGGTGRM